RLLDEIRWRLYFHQFHENVLDHILRILALTGNAVRDAENLWLILPIQLLELLAERLIRLPFDSCSHISAPTYMTLEMAVDNRFFSFFSISFLLFSFRGGFPARYFERSCRILSSKAAAVCRFSFLRWIQVTSSAAQAEP